MGELVTGVIWRGAYDPLYVLHGLAALEGMHQDTLRDSGQRDHQRLRHVTSHTVLTYVLTRADEECVATVRDMSPRQVVRLMDAMGVVAWYTGAPLPDMLRRTR